MADTNDIKAKADRCRSRILSLAEERPVDHLASSLSCIEILVALMENHQAEDALICSKGHAALAVHSVNVEYGFLDESQWMTFGRAGSPLSLHVGTDYDSPLTQWSSGSLGYGLSRASGQAFAKKLKQRTGQVYVLLSDGECQSGITWEAALFSQQHKLDCLTAIVDRNFQQAMGATESIAALEPLSEKWESFGWIAENLNGHDLDQLLERLKEKSQKPRVLIAETQKGHGIIDKMGDHNPHYFRLP